MGHHIDALIGKLPVDIDKIRHYGLATAFENGYAIVLLDRDHLWKWSEITGLDEVSDDMEVEVYDGGLIHFFAKEIGLKHYAVIKTDYFAGMGDQSAILFDEGDAIKKGSINQVLLSLGVIVTDKYDAFEQINLDEYRDTEYYYWSGENNWAKLREGMIAGRMPNEN
jgi:hypothetical protein